MVASAAGELIIAANPADSLPANDVLVYGSDEYVAQDKIEYGFVRLQIGGASASAWRNPGNPFDVNNDGDVGSADALALQAELELRDGQTGLDNASAGQVPYLDVTGDRLITAADLAAVQAQLPAARPATDGPDSGPDQPNPEADDSDDITTKDELLAVLKRWLEMDFRVELRITNGLTLDPITSARVGDIVHVYAVLRVPDEAMDPQIHRLLPFFANYYLRAFTRTSLNYDPSQLELVDSRVAGVEAKIGVYNLGPSPTGEEMLEAMKRPRNEEWQVGGSFVVLAPGAAEISTSQHGTAPGDGLESVPSDVSDEFYALRVLGPDWEAFADELSAKVQQATATINLTEAGARPTAQNDTYDLTQLYGTFNVDAEHGVLANDAAPAGSQALLVRQAEHGTVTLGRDGSIRYSYSIERLHELSDTFEYVVVHPDGTSEFTEVDLRADNVPAIAAVRVRAVNANGIPLEHVEAGQPFFLEATVTDMRQDGVGPLSNARGATDVRIDLGFDSDAIQVIGEVSLDSDFDGSTKKYTNAWAKVAPGDIRVRGVSDTGPRGGELDIFRVPVVATNVGTAEVRFDEARITMRPNLQDIPARLVQLQGLSLEVRENSRPFSNRVNPLDVTGDGAIAPADALEIVNYLNARGTGPVPTLSASISASNSIASASVRRVYLDTDADNHISPGDALQVINHLNAMQAIGEGEAAGASASGGSDVGGASEADLLTLLATDVAADGRRRR